MLLRYCKSVSIICNYAVTDLKWRCCVHNGIVRLHGYMRGIRRQGDGARPDDAREAGWPWCPPSNGALRPGAHALALSILRCRLGLVTTAPRARACVASRGLTGESLAQPATPLCRMDYEPASRSSMAKARLGFASDRGRGWTYQARPAAPAMSRFLPSKPPASRPASWR